MKQLIISLLILTAALTGLQAQTLTAYPDYGDRNGTVLSAGWWKDIATAPSAQGPALSYGNKWLTVSAGLDVRNWKPTYIYAGPQVIAPTLNIKDMLRLTVPVNLIAGVYDFTKGEFDYGAAVGLYLWRHSFGMGVRAQLTKHIMSISVQTGF